MSPLVPEPIDAVIAWVDGSDPELRQKRMTHLAGDDVDNSGDIPAGKSETRFFDNGELRVCLSLLKKNASWINRIFIVTDGQTPETITKDPFFAEKCRVVDHSDIFRGYERYLPTFNSRSIETLLWRIPQLSERFIYLNDDFLIVDKVTPEDFFCNDKVVLRGRWRAYPGIDAFQLILERTLTLLTQLLQKRTRTMHLLAQKKGAQLAGYHWVYFRTPHVPHPMLKSRLFAFFEAHPAVLEKNISFRFRSARQFWPVALSDHLNIRNGACRFESEKSWSVFNGEVDGEQAVARLEKGICSGRIRFLSVAGLERCHSSVRDAFDSMINRVSR